MAEQQNEQDQPTQDNRNNILSWALQNTAESRTVEYQYLWPVAVKQLRETLEIANGTLNVLGGLSGSGKSTALIQLKKALNEIREPESVILFKWLGFKRLDEIADHLNGDIWNETLDSKIPGEEDEDITNLKIRDQKQIKADAVVEYLSRSHSILLDTRDYSTTDRRQLTGDLDGIQRLWQAVCDYCKNHDITIPNFVIGIQAEIAVNDKAQLVDFFLRKARTFKLERFSSRDLASAYETEFGSTWPFTEESLELLGVFARGVFRRFLKYIALCLTQEPERVDFGSQDVNRLVDSTQLEQDTDEELSTLFRSEEERMIAVGILSHLEASESSFATYTDLLESLLSKGYFAVEERWSKEYKEEASRRQLERVVERLRAHRYVTADRDSVSINWKT